MQSQSARPHYDYIISGLAVRSAVKLPSAIPAATPATRPDVVIVEERFPETLPDGEYFGDLMQVAGGSIRLGFPGVLDVLIENGSSMRIQRDAAALEGEVVMFLLGTAFSVLLHQRGRVVLHASAVAMGDKAMLFCGASGAGKSTMAAMLSRRGYPVLNDDVCNLSRMPDGSYTVYPDGRMLKLWSQSLDHLQLQAAEEDRIRSNADKFYMAAESVDLSPRMVGGVYILHEPAHGATPALARLSAVEAVAELTRNAYRPALVRAMKMQNAYFLASTSIAGNRGVYRLSRTKDFSRVDEVLDLLIASWGGATQQMETNTHGA